MEAKAELRRAIKERLSRMSENDRRVESQIILRELRKILPSGPHTIGIYSPYLDEPNLTPLITELLEQKNVVCMPKSGTHSMLMHRILSLQEIGRNPVTNIIEPIIDRPVDETTMQTVVVPGRAFTKEGVRLGRGNGGYDRWIQEQRKRNPATRFIGVCFDCQIVQDMPVEGHDEKVDLLVTPRMKIDTL